MLSSSRCWLSINTRIIVENLRAMRRFRNGVNAMAMVKADAYGLGAAAVAGAIAASGEACRFGVASLAEAVELSGAGLPVQIISSVLPDETAEAVHRGFILPISSPEGAKMISAEACRQGRTVRCELKADTGMGRLGFRYETLLSILPELIALPGLQISGIFSHCPAADVGGDPETIAQIDRFKKLIAGCVAAGMDFDTCHLAASDAICNYPESTAAPFNLIRPGIAMYGFGAAPPEGLELLPAVEFKSRLAAVREMPSGASVGYGRTFRPQHGFRIGVVAAGYADGIPIALSNRGYFMINGVRVPVAGRVSMDYTTVLLPPEIKAAPGDEVLCFGGNDLPLTDWAELKGTIAYDILCSIGRRVRRICCG